ncbi:unnamed protein product [Ambrosiozyma monospora]|uniref:Unnamed protein product n=1 Tax=Ambrosiozyma monospora TaxID=43982 RepID=A0ACB5U6I7_AMBMO|nr:unnamed protein product [Ambrosiozyma monospora]
MACREQKLKCDKLQPCCSRCDARGRQCVYVEHRKTGPKPKPKPKPKSKLKSQSVPASSGMSNIGGIDSNIDNGFIGENFQFTNKRKQPSLNTDTMSSTERREHELGIEEFGLTMADINKMHSHWVSTRKIIFLNSMKRYLYYLKHEPTTVLHFSYSMWALVALELPEYSAFARRLHNRSIELYDAYLSKLGKVDNFSTLYLLYHLLTRTYFQFVMGGEIQFTLALTTTVKITQLAGYDKLDSKLLSSNSMVQN